MKILREILGAPNSLLRALAEHLLIRWLREAGAGQHGPGWQRAYQVLAGRKTWIGLAIGCAGFVAEGLEAGWVALAIQAIGAVCIAGGIADKAVRNQGRPALLADNYFYRLLADHAGLLASVLTFCFAYVTGADCGLLDLYWIEFSCAAQRQILGGATLALVYLGVLDVGFLSRTPAQAAFASRIRALERP